MPWRPCAVAPNADSGLPSQIGKFQESLHNRHSPVAFGLAVIASRGRQSVRVTAKECMPQTKIATSPGGNSRRLLLIVWIFVAVVVSLLAFAYFSLGLMAAARAYVGGEGLWSKAQKESVLALSRYVVGHKPTDYQAYLKALKVSLGDRQARLELDKAQPDLKLAADGFLQGRNHPDDIDGMVGLFRRFRGVPDLDSAIAIWAAADARMDQLMAVGDTIHAGIQTGTMHADAAEAYLAQLQHIDAELSPLEDDFSYALGEMSRKAQKILRLAMVLVVTILLSLAYLVSRRIVRQNERFHQALVDSELQFRNLLQCAPLPILIARVGSDSLVYANERALAQFQTTDASFRELKPESLYSNPKDRDHFVEALRKQGNVRDWEVQLQDTRGKTFWALVSSQRLVFDGQDCILTALNDIDARKQAQEVLRHRAFHDELTGLPNRAMFMDTLNRTQHRSQRERGTFSILFIDLDHFKSVNDNHGHAVGDQLLREVALRVRLCVREGDLVARLGGDEFVILVEGDGPSGQVAQIAKKVQIALEPDHRLGEHVLHVTASIGISSYPQDGADFNELLKNADTAMYRAKVYGRNNFQFHTGVLR